MNSKFIDYARGFAIFTIVLYHFLSRLALSKLLMYAVNFGGAGVHLFFFASGFGLALSKYTTFPNFLKRRLNKVLVPYYIVITIVFLTNLVIHLYPAGLPEYLSHIFLYKMFVPRCEGSFGEHYWFISTIIQFYLAFPLLLWALKSNKYKMIFAVCFAISIGYSLIISFTPYVNERVFNSLFLQYLWEFMLGMIVSRTNSLNKLIGQKLWYYFPIAGIGIALTALLAIKGGQIGKNFNDIFSFAAYTSVVIICYRLGESFFGFFTSFILWICGFSYSLYLLHMFIWDIINNRHLYFVPILVLITLLISYGYDMVIKKILNGFGNNKNKVHSVVQS